MRRWSAASALLSLCLSTACDEPQKGKESEATAKSAAESGEKPEAKSVAEETKSAAEGKSAAAVQPSAEPPPEMPGPGSEAHVGKVGVRQLEGQPPKRAKTPEGKAGAKGLPTPAKH